MSMAAAKQLEGFIAKFDPAIGKLARSARSALRKRFPTAHELVYDNYNALAIGFCTTERTSDCIVSLAVYPKNVALSFFYGAKLTDPHGVLRGSGNQHRYVRLTSAAMVAEPAVAALLQQAAPREVAAAGERSRIDDYQVDICEAATAPASGAKGRRSRGRAPFARSESHDIKRLSRDCARFERRH
jgi:hypothetical protein